MAFIFQSAVVTDSAQINPGVIVNSDVSASAAIEGSKLQELLVSTNAGVIPSTGIVNAHIAAGAAIVLSKIANQTQGELPHFSSGGVLSALGVGTAGQFLKSGGAGADVSWGAGASIDIQEFTSGGTWTKPATASRVLVELWGGGGSGGSRTAGSSNNSATGGGGGGYTWAIFDEADLGATETVTIGAGGTSATGNTNGNDGNDSTFGSHLTAPKGLAGLTGTATTNAGNGGGFGALSNSTFYDGLGLGTDDSEKDSLFGAGGGTVTSNTAQIGGSSIYGGAGGGSYGNTSGITAGGTSAAGGNGGSGQAGSPAGTTGTQPGGGGGAFAGAGDLGSGAGGAGKCVVTTLA